MHIKIYKIAKELTYKHYVSDNTFRTIVKLVFSFQRKYFCSTKIAYEFTLNMENIFRMY